MSKVIILVVSGVASAAVAVAVAVTGMAGQLLKAAVPTLFVGILAVVLVIVAVAAIILLSGCGPNAGPSETAGPGEAARATDALAPTVAASKPTATTAQQWVSFTGQAIEGELTDKALGRVHAINVFWFAWTDFFPDSEVFGVS